MNPHIPYRPPNPSTAVNAHRGRFWTAVATALILAPVGFAQEEPDVFNLTLEELADLTVTVRKRDEAAQDVPVSVTTFTGRQLDNLHAMTLESLQGYVPNVQMQSFANVPHSAVFNIRGMGVIEPDPYGGTTVVVVEDDVPQFFNMTAFLDTFDVERVEVLRGPQGTLFGANSTGGVIQVVNRGADPNRDESAADIAMSMGNYDLLELKGAAQFPVIENVLAARVTAVHQGREGFVTNIVNGEDMGHRDRTAIRGQLALSTADGFTARLIGSYARHRDGAPDSANGDVPGEALFVPAGTIFPSVDYPDANARFPMYRSPCEPAGSRCRAPDKYLSANASVPDISDMDTYAATLSMNWDTDHIEFTSITGFKQFELHDFTDQDWTPAFLDDTERLTEGWQFSQEVRGVARPTDALEVMLGGFYARYSWDHFQDFRIQFASDGLRQLTQNDSDTDMTSVFLQSYLDLSKRWRLQAGLRLTHERTEFRARVASFTDSRGAAALRGPGLNEVPGPFETFLGDTTASDKESWGNIGGKLGFEFDARSDAMVYGYYARGFKSGGFVGRIVIPQDLGPYDEEYVDTVEFGIKTDWVDQRLRINAALFHNWYEDVQLASIYFTTDAFGNTVNGNSVLNLADAKTRGLEFDAIAAPTKNLTLSLSLGYLDAVYSDFPFVDPATTSVIQLSGTRLQNSPKFTVTAGLQHAFQAGSFDVTSSLRYKFVDKKYNNNLRNTPRSEVQPTHLVDLNIDAVPNGRRWSIGLWAKNIFDQRYISSVFDAPGVIGLVDYQEPRTFGVTLRTSM